MRGQDQAANSTGVRRVLPLVEPPRCSVVRLSSLIGGHKRCRCFASCQPDWHHAAFNVGRGTCCRRACWFSGVPTSWPRRFGTVVRRRAPTAGGHPTCDELTDSLVVGVVDQALMELVKPQLNAR